MSKRTAHASGATFYSGRLHAVCSESASQSCCRVYRGRNQLVTMCVPRRERQTLADLARREWERLLPPAVVAPAADLVKRLLALMTQGRAGGEHAAKKEGQRGRRTGDTLTVDVQVCVLCVCVGGGPWQ